MIFGHPPRCKWDLRSSGMLHSSGTINWSHLQESSSYRIFFPDQLFLDWSVLEDGTNRFSWNCQSALCNISEERRCQKFRAFTSAIYTKPTSDRQQWVKMPHTEFHPGGKRNVGSTDRNSCTPLRKVWLPNRRFSRRSPSFVDVSFSGFVENVENAGKTS